MFFGCSPQWDQVLFSAKGRQNPSLLTCDYLLVLFCISSFACRKKATWKFLSPGKTPKKFSLVAPRGCWCGLTPGELPSKGKQFPKCHMHGESKGHFLVHVLQLGAYLQLASGILFTKESHTKLLIIDDWIRSHNCHEKACHQKKVSCADEQQPVVFTALLLVASLTSWRTITFLRTHPSREGIRSSMRKVQIAWFSPAPCGTWSRSPGCSSMTLNTEDPSGTCTHRECDGPFRCGGEPKIENSLAARWSPFGYCQANNKESCIRILGRHLNRNFIPFLVFYPSYPTDIY